MNFSVSCGYFLRRLCGLLGRLSKLCTCVSLKVSCVYFSVGLCVLFGPFVCITRSVCVYYLVSLCVFGQFVGIFSVSV